MDVVSMRVSSNSEASVVAGIPSGTAVQPPRLGQDKLTVTSSNTLAQALEQAPEVRTEEAARARTLVSDASYPPQVLIRKFSELLAIGLAAIGQAHAQEQPQPNDIEE
jgi:hypothetical protein